MKRAVMAAAAVIASGLMVAAQQADRPMSPRASAAAQVGGEWVKGERGEQYQGGKWIEITYGAPLKRGRTNLFGTGADYGKSLLRGAPVWRAGADVTTRLKTEVPLQFGEKKVPAGEYSLFIDLKQDGWTLILSNWAAQAKFDRNNKEALWGAYNYTPDKDVVRTPMSLNQIDMSIEQLVWTFANVSKTGGTLMLVWDSVMAAAPFTVGQ
jgi:Protein of unknown function (DUF2911)